MTEAASESLYGLLPAFYRRYDARIGQPLRALMAVLERERERIHEDVGELYDDWFIETCDDSLVPYIAELVGGDELVEPLARLGRARPFVADLLELRQRKGTRLALERAAELATGWSVKAREATLDSFSPPRSDLKLEVSELKSYSVRLGNACRIGPGRFTFHPLGVNSPLFNTPKPPPGPDRLKRDEHRPLPLKRDVLRREIECLRAGRRPATRFLTRPAAFIIHDPATRKPVPPAAIKIADLSDGERPPAETSYRQKRADGTEVERPVRVVVDPELGVMAFPEGGDPGACLWVSYSYGMSSGVGGGPDYRVAFDDVDPEAWQAILSRSRRKGNSSVMIYRSLALAVEAWHSSGNPKGIVWLDGNATYMLEGGSLEVTVDAGCELSFRAMDGARPVVLGDLKLIALAEAAARVEGLWIGGCVTVEGPLELTLRYATLRPGARNKACLLVSASKSSGRPSLARIRVKGCIVGTVSCRSENAHLKIENSINSGGDGVSIKTLSEGVSLTGSNNEVLKPRRVFISRYDSDLGDAQAAVEDSVSLVAAVFGRRNSAARQAAMSAVRCEFNPCSGYLWWTGRA